MKCISSSGLSSSIVKKEKKKEKRKNGEGVLPSIKGVIDCYRVVF